MAVTALAMPGDRERCLAAGADGYLSKPASLKELVNTIEAYIHGPATSWEPGHEPHEHHPHRG
jgi:CheY-like chemotaxis protein